MSDHSEAQRKQDRIAAVSEAGEIIRLHRSDEAITDLDIANKLGLTEYGVRWLLIERGFEPRYADDSRRPKVRALKAAKRREKYRLPDADIRNVIQLYLDG